MMLLALTCIFPALSLAAFVVPQPAGPYGVSIQDVLLTDHSQPDPYLNLSYRRVPISVISSTGSSGDCQPVLQQYMPNTTAAFWAKALLSAYHLQTNQSIAETELTLCKANSTARATPVVLFAPAAGISRYFYNIVGSQITAQTGYTVITYDIPGQTEIVTYPNGSIQHEFSANASGTDSNDKAIANVVEDATIILNAIIPGAKSTTNITSSPALPSNLNGTTQAAMVGHSQGGAASLTTLLSDSRLLAGADLDGGLNNTRDVYNAHNSSNITTTKPFFILEHPGFNQSANPAWGTVWQDVLHGNKWQFQLNGTQHAAFGDFPYLVDMYGLREEAASNATETKLINLAVGSVPGVEVLEVMKQIFSVFLEYSFGQKTTDDIDSVANELEPWGCEIVNQTVNASKA